MERFVKGEVVVINFPFSDLTQAKRRPALILKEISRGDLILCQITGKSFEPIEEIQIDNNDFEIGRLDKISFIRFTKLFTFDKRLVVYKIGKLKKEKTTAVTTMLAKLLSN